jgi:hypothetical protein
MGRGGSSITATAVHSSRQYPARLLPDPAECLAELLMPPTTGPELPDITDFRAIHEFTHNEFRVVRDEAWEQSEGWRDGRAFLSSRALAFRGKILAEGQEIGYVERHLRNRSWAGREVLSADDDPRLVSYDARLRIREIAYRGQGFANAWNDHLDHEYRQLGVHRHEITAVEVGAYLSAQPDFFFNPVTALHDGADHDFTTDKRQPGRLGAWSAAQLWREYGCRVEELRAAGVIDQQQFQAFRRQFATESDLHSERWRRRFIQPADIASWGQKQPFVYDGRPTWIGKFFILGNSRQLNDLSNRSLGWSGVKLL